MKHRYFLLAGFLFFFILAMLFICAFFIEPLDSVRFFDEKGKLSLNLYFDKMDGVYYLFVPSHASSNDISVHYPSSITVLFEGEPVPSGLTLSSVIGGGYSASTIPLSIRTLLREKSYQLCLCRCEGLDTVWVQTEYGYMTDVDLDKSIKEKVYLSVFDESGNKTYSGKAKITGRGNGTWNQEKNPYNLTFSDKVSVLDFEDITKLCLLANFNDGSGMKNPLVYHFAKEKGIKYTSDYRSVNLFIDGDYKGLYGVVTKQEYEKHIEEDDLKAVFEFVKPKSKKNEYTTENGTAVRFYYGDVEESLKQIDRFETALYSRDYDIAFSYIDFDSFVNKFCLEEFFANYDTVHTGSQYFCIDSDGKIRCMNAWDYDWTLGHNFKFYSNVAHEATVYLYKTSGVLWFRYLIENKIFRNSVIEKLNCDYDEVFCDKIADFINGYIKQIGTSWKCNNLRYRSHIDTYIGSGFETIEEYRNMFSPIIYNRKSFLVSFLSDIEKYRIVNFICDGRPADICLPVGECLSDYVDDTQLQNPNGKPIVWRTQDGKKIDDIKEVNENLIFYGTEIKLHQTTLFMKLRKNSFLLVSLGSVCFLFVLLVFRELYFYYN